MGPTVTIRHGMRIVGLTALSNLQVEALTGGGRMCCEWVFGPPKKPIHIAYGYDFALAFARGIAVGRKLEVDATKTEIDRLRRGEFGGEVVPVAGGAVPTCPICNAGKNQGHDEACPFSPYYLEYLEEIKSNVKQ